MTNLTVTICCEGPTCNDGQSAADREAAIVHGMPAQSAELRDEAHKHARRTVSQRLLVTPHARVGMDRHARPIFACAACGHERVYGGSRVV